MPPWRDREIVIRRFQALRRRAADAAAAAYGFQLTRAVIISPFFSRRVIISLFHVIVRHCQRLITCRCSPRIHEPEYVTGGHRH